MSTTISSVEFSLLKNSSIGERIRLLRRKLMDEVDHDLFTTSSISERTGIAAQTITSIERGESKKPSFSVIHQLSKEFNVSIDVFTDEYYQGGGELFSIGNTNDLDLSDVDYDDIISYTSNNKEYFPPKSEDENKTWHHHRKISLIVHEETPNGEEKQLYLHTNHFKELELTHLLSQLIQTIELSPYNFSSTEWIHALERSPLKEANEIVTKDYCELPNLKFYKEE